MRDLSGPPQPRQVEDLNGNRQCKGEDATPTTYLYVSGKNRLASETTGASTKTYASDNNGNVTGDGTHTYQYSDADRLATVDTGTTGKYTYDGDGRRIIKSVGNSATYFLYDPSGKLLTEASAATAFGKDYLYLRDEPVARVDWTSEVDLGNYLRGNKSSPNVRLDWSLFPSASNVYVVRRKQVVNSADKTFNGHAIIATVNDPTEVYDDPVLNDGNRYDYVVSRKISGDGLFFYHTDHLGTPIAMTDGTGSPVWRAEFRPFGDGTPAGSSVSNLRFPGQYFDGETGLHQNWHRDFAARSGRYMQPDPANLGSPTEPQLFGRGFWEGDFVQALYLLEPARQDPFVYVSGNPINATDRLGLFDLDCARRQSTIAISRAQSLAGGFPGGANGLRNGPADSFRHCYWSCLMVKNCGSATAWAAGEGHEIYDRGFFPNSPDERRMDRHNNEEGRGCGDVSCSCQTCCIGKMRSGALQSHL